MTATVTPLHPIYFDYTLGIGRANPNGRRVALSPIPLDEYSDATSIVQPLADALNALPVSVDDQWWSTHKWQEDKRSNKSWVSSIGVALDVDYQNAEGKHSALPAEIGAKLEAAAKAEPCDMPGNLFHLTPRGCRIVFAFTEPVTDKATYTACATAAAARVASFMAPWAATPGKPGLKVDDPVSHDFARLVFTPRATVEGEARNATVYTVNATPFDAVNLAALAPAAPKVEPKVPDTVCVEPGEEDVSDTELTAAITRFNVVYASKVSPFPKSGQGDCPICKHKSCWGALPEATDKWFCFSSNHKEGGRRSKTGWWGSWLDVVAFQEGKTPIAILKSEKDPASGKPYLDADYEEVDLKGADPSRYLFEAVTGKFRAVNDDGTLAEGIFENALDKLHKHLNKTSLKAFKHDIVPYHHSEMVPTTTDRLTKHNGQPVYNLYSPTLLIPTENTKGVEKWITVADNLCNGDAAVLEYFLDWTALPIQSLVKHHKVTRMLTAMVFADPQTGTGKNTWAELMRAIYTPKHVKTAGQSNIEEKFNSYAMGALMLILNEIQGDRAEALTTADKLKELITDDIRLRLMNRDAAEYPGTWNVLIYSNHPQPIYITTEDRRYVVTPAKGRLSSDLAAELRTDARELGPYAAGMYQWLLNRPCKIKPGPEYMPQTEAKDLVAEVCSSSEVRFMREVMTHGLKEVGECWHGTDTGNVASPFHADGWISRKSINDLYGAWCASQRIRPVQTRKLYEEVARTPGVTESKRYSGTRGFEGMPLTTKTGMVIKAGYNELEPGFSIWVK